MNGKKTKIPRIAQEPNFKNNPLLEASLLLMMLDKFFGVFLLSSVKNPGDLILYAEMNYISL
jgi:hypothetical protein